VGLRRTADSTGPLKPSFSLSVFQLFKFWSPRRPIYTSFRFRSPGSLLPQLLVAAATYLHFVPVQIFRSSFRSPSSGRLPHAVCRLRLLSPVSSLS